MPSFTITHTAQEISDYVKRQFGDESGVQITDPDLIRWINAAIRDVSTKEPLKAIATANLVINQVQYTWPDNILQVQSIRINNKVIKRLSFQEAEQYIIEQDPTNIATGDPILWYEYGGQFFFYPKPDTSITNGIQIFYIPAAVMIDSIYDKLTVPDTYFNALQDHVLSQAYEMDENFNAAQLKSNSFTDKMNNDSGGSVEFDTYPTITVLSEDL